MATLTKSRRHKPTSNGRPPRRMTVREFLALPPDEGFDSALIYGEMVIMPSPTPKHNRAIFYLGQVVDRWVSHHKLGMIFLDNDLILDEDEALVYAPDLMFLATKNLDRYCDEMVHCPVDLAIEILSPSERPYLQQRKFADYESHGIPWYWVVDPTSEHPSLQEFQLVKGKFKCRSEIAGDDWFEPGLFPGLVFRLPPILEGDLRAAVKGKAKKLM